MDTYKGIWVFVETEQGYTQKVSYELISKGKALAEEKKCRMTAVVIGSDIDAVVGEAAAYGAFGRRCRAHCYLKLGSSLEQNLRQGISGLEQQLDQELTQALEQRKNQAIQDGERMETKMLFPMFLLLGLVMAIVMIPAFMSM